MKTMSEGHRNVIDANAQEMHTSLGEMASNNDSLISSFFSGKSVFITGASGFMGKVLVEKLLRSCPALKSIYMLLRTKKNVDPHTRLDDLLKSKVFDKIREINANLLNKVIVVPGDIVLPGLGIANLDTEILIQEVSIVFHSAATVKFDEPMRTSISFNTLGTRHILELCRKMKKLEAFVHVSTAYSNCDRLEVEEQFYPINVPYQKIIELNEWMDDETLAVLTPKLLGDRPNTYTYTKALAEILLLEESGSLPVAIVRPSIVTAAWREPYPGWVDNINGPTGMVLASSKGLLRTMLYNSKARSDLIPVDMVINLMITVAWYTAIRRPNTIQIYNCTSGTINSLKWKDIRNMILPEIIRYPSIQVFRYPGGKFKESPLSNQFYSFTNHLMPAYLFDGIRWICGKEPIMVRIYKKLHRASKILEYFTTRDWNFKANNVIKLSQELKGIDQKIFQFDARNIHWPSYWRDYVIGIRKYILKEDDSTIPKARNMLRRAYYIEKSILLSMVIILWYILVLKTSFINRICTSTIDKVLQGIGILPELSLIKEQSTINVTTTSSISTSFFSSSILTTLASYIGFPSSHH